MSGRPAHTCPNNDNNNNNHTSHTTTDYKDLVAESSVSADSAPIDTSAVGAGKMFLKVASSRDDVITLLPNNESRHHITIGIYDACIKFKCKFVVEKCLRFILGLVHIAIVGCVFDEAPWLTHKQPCEAQQTRHPIKYIR